MKVRILKSLALFVFDSIFACLFIILDFYAIFIWLIKKKKILHRNISQIPCELRKNYDMHYFHIRGYKFIIITFAFIYICMYVCMYVCSSWV